MKSVVLFIWKNRQERLQYVRFMQEITDAILRKNLTTEAAIEKLFEIHIDRSRDNLDEVNIDINKILCFSSSHFHYSLFCFY